MLSDKLINRLKQHGINGQAAEADARGFARAVTNALTRLQEMEPP